MLRRDLSAYGVSVVRRGIARSSAAIVGSVTGRLIAGEIESGNQGGVADDTTPPYDGSEFAIPNPGVVG